MQTETKTVIKAGPHQKPNQCNLLLDFLTKGNRITQQIATLRLGIGHLPRRIKDLKEKGYAIKDRYIEHRRSFDGKKTHVKEYYLEEGIIN